MAYFAAVVTPGGPEWALGGLVVSPVTITHDLTLHFAHVFLQLRFPVLGMLKNPERSGTELNGMERN